MLDWSWPYALLMLPLPLLVILFAPAKMSNISAVRVSHLERWPKADREYGNDENNNRPLYHWFLIWVMWLLFVIGLARPHWVGNSVELPVSGRDLMLAVDISQSMEERDMQLDGNHVNRLQIVKFVLREFIERRVGDRLGLILFGSNAYLQAPLTFDRKTVDTLLNEAALGLAGKRTAIGDAIALGSKRLQDQALESRVIILLTDGANTAGQLEPLEAAELAKELNVKIYTIGLGADSMRVTSFFGTREVNPSRDLDENTLQTIADMTGGRFFRARNPEELEQIYQLIDQLEPTEKDPELYRPMKSIAHWFWIGSLFVLASLLVTNGIRNVLLKHNATDGKSKKEFP